jgi:hypothetical protein
MALVLAAGAWLARAGRLHRLAVVVPLAALLAAGSLLAIGNRQTSAVPSTIATGQVARVMPESSEVQVHSISAIYSQQSRPLDLRASSQTATDLPEVDQTGKVRRIVWDDAGQARWLFVDQPPGVVRHIESDSVVSLPQTWGFSGRFTEDGFRGRLTGLDARRCEDPVIVATAAPALAVRFDSPALASSLSGIQDVLAPDQFIDDRLISDVQQDRQQLLRQMMSTDVPLVGRQPTLAVWTDPIDSGLTFDQDYVRRGTTLALIPISLQRLPPGMDFQVPASFVRLELEAGGRGVSSFFNAQTGKWLDQMNRPNETRLRCLPPEVLLPCQLKRATVRIKITAPSRTLEIKGLVDGQLVTLYRKENPAGILTTEIDRPEALGLDAGGGLPLAISVSATEQERQAAGQRDDPDAEEQLPSRSTWQIDYVHVHLEGTSL